MPRRTIRLSTGQDVYYDEDIFPHNSAEPEPLLNGSTIYGFAGNDTIYAGLGDDYVDGGRRRRPSPRRCGQR